MVAVVYLRRILDENLLQFQRLQISKNEDLGFKDEPRILD